MLVALPPNHDRYGWQHGVMRHGNSRPDIWCLQETHVVTQEEADTLECESVMGHPLNYTFLYTIVTDDSEGRCPNTSLTQRGR